jgi:hypothetical protein
MIRIICRSSILDLRSLRLDAIDMAVLQPFIRDRNLKDGVSNATVNRALEVVRRIFCPLKPLRGG